MDIRKVKVRILGILALSAYLFFTLLWNLYSTQLIHGEQYLLKSQWKLPEVQEVDVARGAILDSYGRPLVTNEISYQVVLDWKEMGNNQQRVETIAQVISLAQTEGQSWNESLNISATPPFTYTVDTLFYGVYQNQDGEDYRVLTRFGEFCLRNKWIDDPREGGEASLTVTEFLRNMVEEYDLASYSAQEQRDIISVIYDILLRQYSIRYDPYYFAESVEIGLTAKLKEANLPGVSVEAVTKRIYHTEYAAHLLGRVSTMNTSEWEYYQSLEAGYEMDDLIGKEGAEQAFESYLRGSQGVREIERNGQGEILSAQWLEEPVPGGNVVLTLDIDLQKKVEDVMAAEIPLMEHKDSIQGAACVLMDVNSGSVLAAASYPSFDLNLYGEEIQENLENPLNPLFNRAFQGTYAPGSTFKMVTGLAALEEELVTPKTTIRDAGVFDHYEAHGPACWIYNQYRGSHGLQNISDAIKNSCNYYFYEVAVQLGIQRIADYADMFGLGQPSGIELTERVGVMAGPAYTQSTGGIWYEGATLSAAIGQESSVFTPLQLTNYISTLVNGGTRYDAHLLSEVKSGDFSQVLYRHDPLSASEDLHFQEENVEAVKKGMQDLILSGSVASDFQYLTSLGINVGAKTGTAQLTSESSASANAVFVCFAPYENPEVAMTIIVEKGGSGGEVASMAAEILSYYFANQENRDEIKKENTLLP